MLQSLIKFSLHHRLLVLALAGGLLGWGLWQIAHMPIDVFPDLNRPRVVIMTEAPGMAPEEVETLITFPLEIALNGASGVEAVRSSSGVGLSVIYVEFAYGTNIYTDRQIVAERLQLVQSRLPPGTQPQLAPISSIMGQILMLGMWSEDPAITPMELRTEADWLVRQRLLTIPGVAQVFTMGGERKQYQVRLDPAAMQRFGVSLEQIETAVSTSNENGTGGYLEQQGPSEYLVRSLGRLTSIEELREIPVSIREGRAVVLSQVAEVRVGAEVKRGDSSAFIRTATQPPQFSGGPAVVLTVNKQPGADTRVVTAEVLAAVDELLPTLSPGTRIETTYTQKAFIERAIHNVEEALRDGVVLVVIILFLFLANFRTTLITLTAIPLSLVVTATVFAAAGLSINTMTLGGIAVAMGELVDDAIVDVENIFRRLKENRAACSPLPPLLVVYRASCEVRRSIVFSTLIVILVFLPLLALGGMEGKLFWPLAWAYIVSILASLFVSLTVTPVLAYLLLGRGGGRAAERDGGVLRVVKWLGARVIRFSLRYPRWNVGAAVVGVMAAALVGARLERDFLPPFNEGTVQLNVVLPPGTSLSASLAINRTVEEVLQEIPDVQKFVRRTGRAELDEHAEGVHLSEYLIELDPQSPRARAEQLLSIRQAMEQIPGIATSTAQPIAHLISHMLSGVKAQVGVKLYGDDLDLLRQHAEKIQAAMAEVPGVIDLMIEPQVIIPQLRIEVDRERLQQLGLTVSEINHYVQTAMNGKTVSQILEGLRTFDLVVRMADDYREDLEALRRLPIPVPEGGTVPLGDIARLYESGGPNTVNRENVRRRVVIQCNVTGRGIVDVVEDIKQAIGPIVADLPAGYYPTFEGQFKSQQTASRTIGALFVVSLVGVFLLLYTLFRSVNLALQVMAALPMAFIGAVAALVLTGQTVTIAALVGFISLAGIASRNGVLLLQHYLHLVEHEGEEFSQAMILRGGLERLAPVLMTALTAGIALVPLVLAADEPGKEILYPVATVILGGVISSTVLDFFVHPAMFWLWGIRSAERVVLATRNAAVWEDEPDTRMPTRAS